MQVEKTVIQEIWDLLEQVSDPEVPVISVVDLGIVRKVSIENGQVVITITPTYSGCPAMNMIEVDIRAMLQEHGYDTIKIVTVLSPAWTTDWLSESGKKKLKDYGIAPPVGKAVDKSVLFAEQSVVQCPHCESHSTKMLSQFGSTACKSLYQCQDCKEPFDYFKCH